MRRIIGAAVAACALLWAGAAGSAVMMAELSGDWNDHPTWRTWSIQVVYNTDNLYQQNTPDGPIYRWASSLPPALISATGTFIGTSCGAFDTDCAPEPVQAHFDISTATSFSISLEQYFYKFSFEGLGVSLTNIGQFRDSYAPLSINDPILIIGGGDYGNGTINGVNVGMPHTHQLLVTALSVPEPTTWAMMIIGFGLAGSALRRNQPSCATGRRQPSRLGW